MPSEPTANRRGRAADVARAALLCLVAILIAACEAPDVIRATPDASPDVEPTETPRAVNTPTIPAPVAADERMVERIAFATRVRRDGEPVDERSVFSESPEQMYLCVQVRDVELGTRFRAYWFAEGQIIGQSDALATRDDDVVWVALGYRPIAALDPAKEHSVELQIDTHTVERYFFRVGAGEAEEVIAEAAFAAGFDAAGKPVDARNSFAEDASELRLLARISRRVDASNMIFTSVWYRGDTAIAYITPETVERNNPAAATPTPAPTSTTTPPRQSTILAFSYEPDSPLPRGAYRVAILLNGTEVRSIPFTVGDGGARDDEEPAGDDRDDDSGRDDDGDSTAEIGQLVITAEIEEETNEPADVNIWVWEDGTREEQDLYATFSVTGLVEDDEVVVVVERDEEIVDTIGVEHEAVESGWIAAAFEIDTPRQAGQMALYRVSVEINGDVAAERTFEVWAVNR